MSSGFSERFRSLSAAGTGDRAARAHAGHEGVDGAVGVVPDLLGRGLAVDPQVRLVLELARVPVHRARQQHDGLRDQ